MAQLTTSLLFSFFLFYIFAFQCVHIMNLWLTYCPSIRLSYFLVTICNVCVYARKRAETILAHDNNVVGHYICVFLCLHSFLSVLYFSRRTTQIKKTILFYFILFYFCQAQPKPSSQSPAKLGLDSLII